MKDLDFESLRSAVETLRGVGLKVQRDPSAVSTLYRLVDDEGLPLNWREAGSALVLLASAESMLERIEKSDNALLQADRVHALSQDDIADLQSRLDGARRALLDISGCDTTGALAATLAKEALAATAPGTHAGLSDEHFRLMSDAGKAGVLEDSLSDLEPLRVAALAYGRDQLAHDYCAGHVQALGIACRRLAEREAADRLLDPSMPEEDVDAELVALGVDPKALAERGVEFVKKIKAALR